jgi:hypothetical protein
MEDIHLCIRWVMCIRYIVCVFRAPNLDGLFFCRADPQRVRELPGDCAARPLRHLPEQRQGRCRPGRQASAGPSRRGDAQAEEQHEGRQRTLVNMERCVRQPTENGCVQTCLCLLRYRLSRRFAPPAICAGTCVVIYDNRS